VTIRRLLILAGTTEAARIARSTVDTFGNRIEVISSFAGRLHTPPAVSGDVRVGGFGGAEGMADYLRTEKIDGVIDATHPFAADISHHGAAACRITGTPRLMVVRPPWQPTPGDNWICAPDLQNAARLSAENTRRAFLATGSGSASHFSGLTTVRFLVRVFEPPERPLPIDDYMVVVARPPFTVDREVALMRAFEIEALVCKQSGGPTDAKLAAARELKIPVIMVQRPPIPDGAVVNSVDHTIQWVADHLI
jgi:precorrin-6A/cobalt-precorrin-6A reductase